MVDAVELNALIDGVGKPEFVRQTLPDRRSASSG